MGLPDSPRPHHAPHHTTPHHTTPHRIASHPSSRAGRMIAEIVRERVGGVCGPRPGQSRVHPSLREPADAWPPSPAAPCTARTPRRFTRPTRWLLPAVGFLKCAHICPRSKRESARLPVACALGRLLGTHTLPLTLTHLSIAGGASAGSSPCSASPMEAPKVRLAPITPRLARTFPPPTHPTAVTNHRPT